jgi:hypothetical protein
MATSGTTNLTTSRDEIIKRALRIVGGLGQGETPTADQVSEASIALNMLTKHLANKGLLLWSRSEITVTPVQGQETYEIGPGKAVDQPRPLKIYSVDRNNATTGLTIGLIGLSQSDFNAVNVSSISSTPSQYWVEPLRESTKLHVYPYPDATFVANETFKVYYQRVLENFDAAGNEPDVPQEFFDVLVYGLADRLTVEYGTERFLRGQIKNDFKEILADSLMYNNEEESLFFQPDRGW